MGDNNFTNSCKEDRFETLLNNTAAAKVIARAVEGTIGPKGLDIMMIDNFGEVVVTNDGITILKLMAVSHPVAQMIINTAQAQQAEVGDGTTTAVIIAGALIAAGTEQILKGVPVTRVTDGIRLGIDRSLELLNVLGVPITNLHDPMLRNIALVAGRGDDHLAAMVVAGTKKMGLNKLNEPDYKFPEAVIAKEFAANHMFSGVVINRLPNSQELPKAMNEARILVVDDALKPDEMEGQALATEAGFSHYLQTREQFMANLARLSELGINTVITSGAIDDRGEHLLSQAGIFILERVSRIEIDRLCKYTGARRVRRNTLNNEKEILKDLGTAQQVIADEKMGHTYILSGQGQEWVTLLIGAATEEIVDEKERMAKDAAASVQASIKGGIVPGGGAIEIWIANQLENLAKEHSGLESYGILCVKEALIKPFCCMASNAGFNPLEKLGEVSAMQKQQNSACFSFDSESGKVVDMLAVGIVDPTLAKVYAYKAAAEVAIAVLRINAVIKMQLGDDLNINYQD